MSSIELNNKEKFNFELENGLPYKPVITSRVELYTQKYDKKAGVVDLYIKNKFEENVVVQKVHVDEDCVYLDIGDFYIVGEHFSSFIYQSATNNTLGFRVFNGEKMVINGRMKKN